ncbi:HAMP domain-containing histidine kinase [Corynebacterium sp. 320]|uniref:Sensor histidine kinase MtrB n=1 Tax=Corynebacterium zhongnanshanii TaxID=2768834 RepID=A0ABQ6VGR6_9CORY|nr:MULTISPECIES: MtrAB system histidine kinase MtrB [Corynebacterium]KAB1504168.1 HAMP domain-containing histidine kinase [Corynebacterium sp. 320]KAB1552732.1 HAMP domain-containing histidine kinase [Corynebacterium sp. 321]KAB1554050.1 HAMP domain-containing histidine kinase [Corynebacterium sp. 319]KAB3522978.1 HAMP domain-containing histidine kinase [Corynebacterium zhongnanshanii]KAB3528304.1 HAMP domain-containing histidine kinase [Corynebacterium sp. 250]
MSSPNDVTPAPSQEGSWWDHTKFFFSNPPGATRSGWKTLRYRWRTSVQVRVVWSVFIASFVVISILGIVLTSFLGQQLLNAEHDSAVEEMDRARVKVQEQIAATNPTNPVAIRLTSARAVLVDRNPAAEKRTTAVFEPVLISSDVNNEETVVPDTATIPEELRDFVRQGQVATQHVTMPVGGNPRAKALIIGSPVASDIANVELYLIFPLDAEESTLSLMRGLLMSGGIVLIVLLVVIVWMFSQQVTVPIRRAALVAERFADGNLRERMVVNGQDEVARLGSSFNQMAEKLSTQIRELREFGSVQQRFTSDVSHELRTPLTTVRMAADLIQDNADNLDPMTARASALMSKELDRFESLLGDLLEISRHDAGVANLSNELVDVRGIIRSAHQQVHAIAEETGAEVRLNLPDSAVMMEVDSRRVERIVRNLMANAVDHSESRPVDVTLAVGESSMALTVVDHGVGLKPGEENLVFNRFWRSDPSRERRTGGTGLGLAIAKEDAELHGGRLEAIGEPGVGACFRLTLPRNSGDVVVSSPLPLAVDRTLDNGGSDDEQ